jgi:hypothetical protein
LNLIKELVTGFLEESGAGKRKYKGNFMQENQYQQARLTEW